MVSETISLRMTDGYGIATNYTAKNECPYDGTKLHKTGTYFGCFDGEWTEVDNFTCDNNCKIRYYDIRKAQNLD